LSQGVRSLVFFTGSFPFPKAAEDTFIGPEIESLATVFDRVFIIPANIDGFGVPLQKGIAVDTSFSKTIDTRTFLKRVQGVRRALSSGLPYRELLSHPAWILDLKAIKRIVSSTSRALQTKKWVVSFINREGLDVSIQGHTALMSISKDTHLP